MMSIKREQRMCRLNKSFLTFHFILCETDQCSSAHVKPVIVAVFQGTHTHAHTHRKWKGMSGEMHLEWMR